MERERVKSAEAYVIGVRRGRESWQTADRGAKRGCGTGKGKRTMYERASCMQDLRTKGEGERGEGGGESLNVCFTTFCGILWEGDGDGEGEEDGDDVGQRSLKLQDRPSLPLQYVDRSRIEETQTLFVFIEPRYRFNFKLENQSTAVQKYTRP